MHYAVECVAIIFLGNMVPSVSPLFGCHSCVADTKLPEGTTVFKQINKFEDYQRRLHWLSYQQPHMPFESQTCCKTSIPCDLGVITLYGGEEGVSSQDAVMQVLDQHLH